MINGFAAEPVMLPSFRHLPLAMALTFLLTTQTFNMVDGIFQWLATEPMNFESELLASYARAF
jgi:hypothetical protein